MHGPQHEFSHDLQNLKAPNRKQKYEKICFAKLSVSISQLCSGLPTEFATYMGYVRGLNFDDTPDYTYIRRLFRDLFVREGFVWDFEYDWTVLRARQQRREQCQEIARDALKVVHVSSSDNQTTDKLIEARREEPSPVHEAQNGHANAKLRSGARAQEREPLGSWSRCKASLSLLWQRPPATAVQQ